MSELTKCLNTLSPRVLEFSKEINAPADPVHWALEMFTTSVVEADMQFREVASKDGSEPEISYFDQQDPESAGRFKAAVHDGQPVHGSLALIDYCSGDGILRKNADWAWDAFDKEFAKALEKLHPMGSYLRSTLWMSSGEHVYSAHCDLADGFLVHMHGRKRVRVWPIPEKYRQDVVFNHNDFDGRMASEPLEFELQPGQILFIPSGAMHEVVAQGTQTAVSLSYHMGSPFPLLTLCAQLNKLLLNGEVSLAADMSGESKFDLFFFEPTRFIRGESASKNEMPHELTNALMAVLESDQLDEDAMRKLLSDWWGVAMSDQIYQGPYP